MTHEPGSTSITTAQAVINALAPLLGTWRGQGKGTFPTLDDFVYSETLYVRRDPDVSYFTYQQETTLIDSQGHPIRKSHWEAGVIRPKENGSVELACVQGSGRVEVLLGKLLIHNEQPEMLILQFESKLIGNDDEVKTASRTWTLAGNHFTYVVEMATSQVEAPSLHLETTLFKD